MNDTNCKKCLFNDVCNERIPCEHYTQAGDDMTEDELEKYIEDTRLEFRKDWWRYIDDACDN